MSRRTRCCQRSRGRRRASSAPAAWPAGAPPPGDLGDLVSDPLVVLLDLLDLPLVLVLQVLELVGALLLLRLQLLDLGEQVGGALAGFLGPVHGSVGLDLELADALLHRVQT